MTEYLVARLNARVRAGEPIASITAYDYFTALLACAADMDFVLVGDSLGNVVQGGATTVPVTLEQMIYHTRIVCAHFPAERVVLDMPFGSFKVSAAETVSNALMAFKESGCGGIKIEGATADNLEAIEKLTQIGVPVVGHLGLLPQRVYADGGYRMQGRTLKQAQQLMADAKALQRAGACAVVLECVVPQVAADITAAVEIPTIGIGSGAETSGQIAVVHDVLGMLPGKAPSFARRYAEVFAVAEAAVKAYSNGLRVAKSEVLHDNRPSNAGEDSGSGTAPSDEPGDRSALHTGTYGNGG